MALFFDFDPDNGVSEYVEYDAAVDKTYVRTEQDVSPILDRAAELRHTGSTDRGIKDGLWHYATIPPVVGMELMKKGINIYSGKYDYRALVAEINANYPYLKTTNKSI